jgi:protein-S-isoprenylcysteine O-methyltransferase Ste14
MPRERDRIYEFIFLLSLVLLTGNWFIGGVPLLALTLVVVWRLGREEAAMIEKFGDDYRATCGAAAASSPAFGATRNA